MGKVIASTYEQVAKRFDIEGKVTLDKPDMLGSSIRHGLTQEEVGKESVLQLYASNDDRGEAADHQPELQDRTTQRQQ